MNCQGALRSHVRACLSVKCMLIVFLTHTKHMRLHRSRCLYVHLSLKAEMRPKAALTDNHVNGGVVEIEFGRPVEG